MSRKFAVCLRLLCLPLLLMLLSPAAVAAKHALVIGNNAYSNLDTLQKAVGDANGYAGTLKGLGFKVSLHTDLTLDNMNRALAEFLGRLKKGDTAFFVFSGHGWSDGTANYLLGTDAPRSGSDAYLKKVSMLVQNGKTGVLDEILGREVLLQVAVIDACRDNPFSLDGFGRTIGISRGIVIIDAPKGTFVIQSAGLGQQALDRLSKTDPDPYSVFTRVFLPLLATGRPLNEVIKPVQSQVAALARGIGRKQEPEYRDGVTEPVCLSVRCDSRPLPPSFTAEEKSAYQRARATNTVTSWTEFLSRFPNGSYAEVARRELSVLSSSELEPQSDYSQSAEELFRRAQSLIEINQLSSACDPLLEATALAHSDAAKQVLNFLVTGKLNCRRSRAAEIEIIDAFQKGAAAGSIEARYSLGFVLRYGLSTGASSESLVPANAEAAIRHLKIAADSAHPAAMNLLGEMLESGEGSEQQPDIAARWFEKSALGDNTEGIYNHGRTLVEYGWTLAGAQSISDRKKALETWEGGLEYLSRAFARGKVIAGFKYLDAVYSNSNLVARSAISVKKSGTCIEDGTLNATCVCETRKGELRQGFRMLEQVSKYSPAGKTLVALIIYRTKSCFSHSLNYKDLLVEGYEGGDRNPEGVMVLGLHEEQCEIRIAFLQEAEKLGMRDSMQFRGGCLNPRGGIPLPSRRAKYAPE